MSTTVAFVGAAGGVGTTRLTLESGRLLAANGVDTAILDASYGTQGLSDRISGRLDPDVTALCLRETPLEEGLVDLPVEGAGRLAACPAHAPFERLARAKTADAAERFGELIDEAARHFECVLVDTPPVATNPAVAAVTAVEAVAIICDGDRAQSALPRTEDRLSDVGTSSSTTFVTRTSEHPDADVAIPTFDAESPATEPDAPAHAALCDAVETITDVSIDRPDPEGVLDQLRFK
jgi:septum site-determining protein MinD